MSETIDMKTLKVIGKQIFDKLGASTEDLENLDYEKSFENFEKAYKEDIADSDHVNVLITGKSGVGKSTLINAMFGEEVAITGTGTPVTQQTQLFENENTSIRIYDTKGFEISGTQEIADEIKKIIVEKNQSTKKDDMIGVIWYAIAANAGRIEETEINFIKELVGSDINVPVILVLTKADNRDEFLPLRKAIEKENLAVAGIVNVLAEDTPIYHPITGNRSDTIEAYGLDDLAQMTYQVLPDLQKLAFANQQRVDEKLKEEQALKNHSRARAIITTSIASAFAEGFAPIPLADSMMMIPTQMAMVAGINAVYRVDLSKSSLAHLVTTLAGTQAAAFTGRLVASNLLKLIPVAGTATGGAISGATGAMITAAMGLGYEKLIEMSQTNEWRDFGFDEFLKKVDIESVLNSIDIETVKNIVSNAKIKAE